MKDFVFLIVFITFQKSYVAFNTQEGAVNISFNVTRMSTCRTEKDMFRRILGVGTLPNCVRECGLRSYCEALCYRRKLQGCDLFTTRDGGILSNGDCIFIAKSEIKVEKRPCGICLYGQLCDMHSKQCKYKECIPTRINNGTVLGNLNEVGSKIRYKCNHGYRDKNRIKSAVCKEDGTWNVAANCTRFCSELPTIHNGTVALTEMNRNFFMDTANVTCDRGYQGSVGTIQCTASGDWENASCDPIVCSELPTIHNGTVALTKMNRNFFMDTANVTCDRGYQGSVGTIQCTASGDWENASCDPIVCSELPTIHNGTVALTKMNRNFFMDTANVTCDRGYQGSVGTIQCTASGDWENASCDPIVCSELPTIHNGTVALTKKNRNFFMDTANVTCDRGYQGSVGTIQCTASGDWENASCDPIVCSEIPTIYNGTVALTKMNRNFFMDTANVTCDRGYQGSVGTIQCTASGDWENASCDPSVCSELPTIHNGTVALTKMNRNFFMDTANVTCDRGYQGSVGTIQCTASGDWENASCDPSACGNPPSIANGNVTLITGTLYMDTASVTCDSSYKSSSNIITCTASGTWEMATCEDCYIDDVRNYHGTKNITKNGYVCERWDAHAGEHDTNAQYIPESTLSDIENYCRNPTGNNWPLWCFSSFPYVGWDFCDISQC